MADLQLSPHFWLSEFACKCGNWPKCTATRPTPELISALEKLRAKYYPDGLRIKSGVRCRAHNEAVGGKVNSQHLVGRAVDLEDVKLTPWQVRRLRLFRGIGILNGRVLHVDVRRTGSKYFPDTWAY